METRFNKTNLNILTENLERSAEFDERLAAYYTKPADNSQNAATNAKQAADSNASAQVDTILANIGREHSNALSFYNKHQKGGAAKFYNAVQHSDNDWVEHVATPATTEKTR